MLISCHIPKTAGFSFATALRNVYGESFLWDMSHESILAQMFAQRQLSVEEVTVAWLDRYEPPRLTTSSGGRLQCIHGHFPLRKYLRHAFDPRNKFVVWLREPLQWRISLYYFFQGVYPHPSDMFVNKVFGEKWDLERFCMDETFDNYHSRYLARFPSLRINFIGVTENYASDLDYLSRNVLRRELPLYHVNRSRKPADLSEKQFDAGFLRRFESKNELDYRVYRRARRVSDLRAARRAA